VTIRAEVKVNSRLTEIERRFAIPLVEIAQQFVPGMVERIRRGMASVGTFAPLGAYSPDKLGPGLFWVAPKSPQPAGYVVKVEHGKWTGWAAYRSYRDYARARGGGPRTFTESGARMRALAIRLMGPGRVKVAFYGSHATTPGEDRQSNANVAFLASRREPYPMLTPSRTEIEQVVRLLQSEVGAQVVGEAAEARDVRGLGQRVTRLQKRMSAASQRR
jgi:hypothetical protein